MKTKKMKSPALIVAGMLGTVAASPAATLIAYSYATIANSTDTSWVVPTGATSIKAMNLGSGADNVFGGVTWLTTNAGIGASTNGAAPISMSYHAPGQAWGTRYDNFYSAGTDASAILLEGTYSGTQAGGVDYRVDLAGFTVGQEYLVQFVLADYRGGGIIGRSITIDGYSANIAAQDSAAYQFAFGDDRYAVVTARFTPGVGDTDFAFVPSIGGGGLQLNAIQILTIPEPSSALLGGLGLLAMLRRRR